MKTRPGTVAYEGPVGTHRLGPARLEGETSALLGPSYVWSLSLLGPRYGYLYFYFFILFYFISLYYLLRAHVRFSFFSWTPLDPPDFGTSRARGVQTPRPPRISSPAV